MGEGGKSEHGTGNRRAPAGEAGGWPRKKNWVKMKIYYLILWSMSSFAFLMVSRGVLETGRM